MPSRRVTDFLLFAAVFTMSFEKLFWNVAGKIALTEVFAIFFVGAYVLRRLGRRDWSLPRTSGIVIAFFAAFLLVYLIGFYNLETTQGLTQFGKGMGKFVLHFAFLVAAVDYLFRSGERVYWRMLAWFCFGVAANAAYGVLQLAAAQAGRNLDATLIEPITGH
jgi:predicted PurR-regulated permease PerM